MPSLTANGIDIAYQVAGSGPPVVMLHGAGSTASVNWTAQVPRFTKAFHVYLPDARGHGGTRWDVAGGFSMELLVADLAAFVDALELPTFHVVGFSMGATTALVYATHHSERIRTLILGGVAIQPEPRTSVARRLMDPERILRDDPAWAAQLTRRHDGVQGAGAWQRLLPAIAADVARQDTLTPRELRRVTCPTLVAVGDRDPFVPVDHAWGLQRQLPDARLFVAPDCGHEVMSQRAGLFNEACGLFYRTTEAEARRRAGLDGGAAGSAAHAERQEPESRRAL